jgi:predicted anti-sigma-YlaC factor YlaD
MGGDPSRVDSHYNRALEIADGRLAGPYMSYAEAVVIGQQDRDLFVSLMEQALAVDPEAYPNAQLINVLTQRKARWYLENLDDYFLPDLPPEEEGGS